MISLLAFITILHSSIPSLSYDLVFTVGADVILKQFNDFNCRVVFSAEGFCWPDQTLAVSYTIWYRIDLCESITLIIRTTKTTIQYWQYFVSALQWGAWVNILSL